MYFNPVFAPQLIYVIGALALSITAVLYWRESHRLSMAKNGTLLVFRLLATALIVALLLQPSRRQKIHHDTRPGAVLVAIDSSQSMAHADDGKTTRLERVRDILREADINDAQGNRSDTLRFYRFDATAKALSPGQLDALQADGEDTQVHTSIQALVDDNKARGTDIDALLILSDGHDFELAGIQRTARIARFGRFPIYTVAVGSSGRVRDIATRIANYQPYSYVGQKAEISAVLRVIGVDYENITVQLRRDEEVVDSRNLSTGEESEITVRFEVVEDQPGQYPYEIRVLPVSHETDADNNSASTYLNVIDEKMRGLLLEGNPYWDTTFLQRSLYRNDKIDLDSISALKDETRLVRLRNDAERGDLSVPETEADFLAYDVVILGQNIERILKSDRSISALKAFVEQSGGTVIFARGHPLGHDAPGRDDIAAIEPVTWHSGGNDNLRLDIVRDGRAVGGFPALADRQRSSQPLPPLVSGRRVKEAKPLSSILAEAHDPDTDQRFPAFIHRRAGRGQVLTIGVSGLWRWGLAPGNAARGSSRDSANSRSIAKTFDQFWDQTLVWLLSQSDNVPTQNFSFRANTANLALGERLTLRLVRRSPDADSSDTDAAPLNQAELPLAEVFRGNNDHGSPLATVQLSPAEGGGAGSFIGEFVPQQTGRYYAEIKMPEGNKAQLRFMVYDQKPELTELAADVAYLRKIATATGGQLLAPGDLGDLFQRVAPKKEEAEIQYELIPIWNQPWVFYLIAAFLGTDWYLRRRWGLT